MKKIKIKTKTIRDIIQGLKWKDVNNAKKYFYPEDKNNYEPVFRHLLKIKPRKHKDAKEFIELEVVHEALKGFPEEHWYDMVTNKYSMSFRKWAELANIPISENTLNHYKYEEIIVHFIWEITFYGTEADSMKKAKEIQEIVDDYKRQQKEKKK